MSDDAPPWEVTLDDLPEPVVSAKVEAPQNDLFLPESYGDILLDVEQPAHSSLGASAAERWLNCPGSIAMSKGMPNKSSIYAMEGTAAHSLGELCLRQDLSADVFAGQFMTYKGDLLDEEPELEAGQPTLVYDGNVLDAANPAFPINDEMVWAVNKYLETIDYWLNWAREKFGVEPQLLIEKRFNLESVWPGMFGTNDCCVFVPGKCLIVIDYKHGRGKVVEIKDNKQLKYYGLGAIIELCIEEMVREADYSKERFEEALRANLPPEITTVIVQPRATHKDGPVREWTYTTEHIIFEFREELIEGAKRTEEPDAPLKTGDWCFFCAGKIKCPKITKKYNALTKNAFADLSPEDLAMPGTIIQNVVRDITNDPERLGEFLRFAPIMEDTIKAIREMALQMAEAGTPIPGQKLVRRDTKRKYTDEMEVGRKLLSLDGITPQDIWNLKLKSPSALKKLGVKKWRPIEKVLEEGEYVYKPEGALTLADADDARPEVVVNAFADLDVDDLVIDLNPEEWDIL